MRTSMPLRPSRRLLGFFVFTFAVPLSPLHSEPENPPRHTVDLRATATARLELLDKAEEHPANLLRYKICAIFREWGRRDLADAEAFIDALPHSEIWCPSMNPADIREALRYAALIGASAADPEQAWRRLIHHESGLACEILPTERLGQFLACDGGQ